VREEPGDLVAGICHKGTVAQEYHSLCSPAFLFPQRIFLNQRNTRRAPLFRITFSVNAEGPYCKPVHFTKEYTTSVHLNYWRVLLPRTTSAEPVTATKFSMCKQYIHMYVCNINSWRLLSPGIKFPCNLLKANWCFGGTCSLLPVSWWLLPWLIPQLWRWRCYFSETSVHFQPA
jgi:hypothetical protein